MGSEMCIRDRIYTDANDEVYWNQTYEMKEPMADVCEDYVALADKGGTEIYIMNQAGMQGKIETPMNISRISVANQGVVAVWMESDGENYIRMYDKNGKNLVKETRNVYYRRSLPKERVVLEQLAKGPMEEGHYATIPDSSLVLSVITADRICYINMNSTFRDETPEVGENISIYSVVNSIIDSCDVDRVQISIEGSTEGNFQDSLPLYKFYEKNEDLIAQDEEPK